ncbi:hypothetical protein LB504_005189 [Fusarium proliferatum]|nr:hypothetical protein LB504_005189 [Fusarium proliferatum]
MDFIDYYEILNLHHTADENEIKTAYRQLAKTIHPDKNQENNQATQNFQKLNEAYSTLSDTRKRRVYDLKYERQTGSYAPRFSSIHRTNTSTHENTAPNPGFSDTHFEGPVQNDSREKLLLKIWEADGFIEQFKSCAKSTEKKARRQRRSVEEKKEVLQFVEEKISSAEVEMKRKYEYGAGPSNLERTREYRLIRMQMDYKTRIEAELKEEEEKLALLERQLQEFSSRLSYWKQKRDAFDRN